MNNKLILIIFIISFIVFVCFGFLYVFDENNNKNNNGNIITEEEFLAANTEYKNVDEVIEFLSNLYDSEDVKVISNDESIYKIKAVLKDGTIYNYIYEISSHTLNVDDASDLDE